MEIILLKDIDNLGYKNDVVKVKNGFGRNYLIPQGFGVIANATNREKLDKIIQEIESKEAAKLDEYKALAKQLVDKKLSIAVKAGTSGKIFGSVNTVQIANALQEQLGLEVERKKIHLPESIKEIGTYTATIQFSKEVSQDIDFDLIQD
jgi:large subunit ribosomal protein L9